jgi:hypothetical protein
MIPEGHTLARIADYSKVYASKRENACAAIILNPFIQARCAPWISAKPFKLASPRI